MARPTIFSYTIQDKEGVKAVSNYYVAYDGATLTEDILNANWVVLGGLINAITDGVIIGGHAQIDYDPDGAWRTTPAEATSVSSGAEFNFNQAASPYVQAALIPAFAVGKIANGHPDLTDSAVAAYVTDVTRALGLPGSNSVFVNSKYNNALKSLRDTFLNTRKHRKQLTKASFEV